MSRASVDDVKAIIEYDDIDRPDLRPHIRAAENLVNWLENTCDVDNVLTNGQLRDIETWLAAHFYNIRDQGYQTKSTQSASGTFQGQTAMHLQSSYWGQTAMLLDVTGCLAKLNKEMEEGGKRKVKVKWLGKAPSSQTDYKDRD